MKKAIDFNIHIDTTDKELISKIEYLVKNNIPLNEQTIEVLLDHLSYIVRKRIAEFEEKDLNNYLFEYKCDLAQSMICYYLQELGLKVNPVNTNEVLSGTTGHSFALTKINTTEGEKEYLIDPTYIQFFSKEGCSSKKYVIINNQICISPDPGYFIIKNGQENRIMPLLNKGHIEFTEEIAKIYGDSFFQTKTGGTLEQVKYNTGSGSMYLKWFNSYTSKLSKTKEELEELNLLIRPTDSETYSRKK